MAIDASIPLGVVVPKPESQTDQLAKALTLKSAMQQSEMGGLQLEAAKKNFLTDEKIKGVFSSPDAFVQDANGNRTISPAAIDKVFALDPNKGMALQQNHLEQTNATLKMQHLVKQMSSEDLAMAEKKSKMGGDAALAARNAYLDYLKDAPGDVAGATEIAKQAYAPQLKSLVDQKIITPEQAQAELQNFSPSQISSKAMQSQHYYQQVSDERKSRDEARRDKQIEIQQQRADIAEQRASASMAAIAAKMGGSDEKLSSEDMSFMAKQYLAGDKSVM